MSVDRRGAARLRATGRRIEAALPLSVPAIAGIAAVATAAPLFLARFALNAPVAQPVDVGAAYDSLALLATVGPALAAVAIGVDASDQRVGVGLLFVGVFGSLSVFSGAAAVPAALATAGGGAVALGTLARNAHPGSQAVAVLGMAAVTVSLAGAFGLATELFRPMGSRLALLTLAATPFAVGGDRRLLSWIAGALVGAGVLLAISARPFVAGAVTLVGGGVVGSSALFVALALAGGTTALSSTVRRRLAIATLGVCLLILAGVPASVPRAVPAVLGLTLLVGGSRL